MHACLSVCVCLSGASVLQQHTACEQKEPASAAAAAAARLQVDGLMTKGGGEAIEVKNLKAVSGFHWVIQAKEERRTHT